METLKKMITMVFIKKIIKYVILNVQKVLIIFIKTIYVFKKIVKTLIINLLLKIVILQIFAFIIVIGAIIAGCVLIKSDKDATGLGIIISALASLVGVFVYGRSQERKERIEKAKQVPEIK